MSNPFSGIRLFEEPRVSPLRPISGNPFSGISLFETETEEQKRRREEEEKRRRAEAWRAARMPAGALPVEQMPTPKDPLKEMSLAELLAGQVGARVKAGVASLLDVPEAAAEVARSGAAPAGKGSVLGRLAPALNPLAPLLGALPEGTLKPGGLVGGMRESVREDYERAQADVQALGAARGWSPVATAATETTLEAGGVAADPTNLLPAGGALKGARRLGGVVDELADLPSAAARVVDQSPVVEAMAHAASDVSPEAISRVQSGVRFWRVRPDGEVVPILNDVGAIDAPVGRGELKVQTSPAGDVLVLEGRANAAQQRAVGQLRDAPPPPPSLAVPAGLGESALPLGEESLEGADDLLAQLGVRRGEGVERLAARAEGTGLADLGKAGKAIADNLYESVWQRLRAGKKASPFAVNPPAEEAVEQAFRQGKVAGVEDVRRIMNEVAVPPRPPLAAVESGAPDPLAPLRGGELPIEAPGKSLPAPTIPMSTKALENVAGAKEEFHRLVQEHLPEIEAARGPVRPASVWHDAKELADRTGMALEDFLASPAGRTFDDREVSLAKSYMAGLQTRHATLDKAFGAMVEGVEKEAARDALAKTSVDLVRMMKIVQGSYSTAGRTLRSGQEALAAFSGSPKQRLQYALLQRYGAQNAEEAAQIEVKAIARLKRQAAAEARAAKRTATVEELATEFEGLRSEFRSAMTRPRAGLDPELVGIVGKMAKNRVAAGIVEIEKIADDIYLFARDYMEGVTREDIKAAIVQATEPKPKKKAPAGLLGKVAQTPEQAKLARMEAATQRQVKLLEERIATGPKLPGQRLEVDSAKLQELRAKAANLKRQIEADPREGLVKRYRELLDDQTVEMIAKLPDPEKDPAALVNFIRHMEKPRFRDYRTSYWINSILSGTKTMTRNLVGNAVRLAEQTAMRPAGAAVEQFVLAPLQGRAPERLVREAVPATVAVFRGLPDGLKRFAFVMKEGYDPSRLIGELTGETVEKFDAGARLPLSPFLLSKKPGVQKLGTVLTMPSRILEATDAMFKVMAHTSEQYAWATRKAIQEKVPDIGARVAELIAEQPDEMLEAARAFAKKATYQDPMSWVGRSASTIRRGVPGSDVLAERLRLSGGTGNRILAGIIQAPQTIGQHLMPFVHISDRVAAGITDYIPFSKPAKLARSVAAGIPGLKKTLPFLKDIPPDEAADLIARQVVGGALGMLGVSWAADGRLVGEAPRDEKLRNDFYADGKQPYSILIAGHWVPMRDVLGPLAGPFVAAAMYHDHTKVGEDPSEAVAGMTLGSARYMLDASYMQTLQDVIQAVDQEATGQAGRGLTQAGARVASGYAPFSGFQRNVATALDPRVVDKEGFLQEIQAGIPGLREQLPSRLDSLGNPIVSNTGFWGGFSPMVPTESKIADPELAEEVGRLRYTVAGRRREVGRLEAKIKDAEKSGDQARVQELVADLPLVRTEKSPWATAWFDDRLDRVRELENAIRQLRASEMTPEEKKAGELDLMAEIKAILEDTLATVNPNPEPSGGQPNPFAGVPLFE